jgi:curved DNA-binding protein CbpA
MEPTEILGVSADATDDEIRAAYLSKVQEHPPDRSPEQFELIRDAYEALRDPRRRLQQQLFGGDPAAPFVTLLDASQPSRRFAGPHAWRDVLRGK